MNVNSRPYFTFYESFFTAIDKLEISEQLPIYRAIAEYALYHKEPDLVGTGAVMWELIRPNLESNWVRWENGRKGGAPTGNTNAVKQPKNNQNSTKKQPTPSIDKEIGDKNKKLRDKNKDIKSSIEDSQDAEHLPRQSIDFEKLVEKFMELTNGKFGNIKTPLSENRKKLIRARVSEYGKNTFIEVIKKASKSSFLSGQNPRGFTLTFDWLIKPTNFEKILSGNYDDKPENKRYNGKPAKNDPTGAVSGSNYETVL